MNSFALYYKEESGFEPNIGSSEVQVNVWKMHSNKKSLYYLDFGLQFKSRIKEIAVYLPFVITKSDIQDLGVIISKDDDMISRLFNAETNSSKNSKSLFTPVEVDSERSFEVCSLDFNNKADIDSLKVNDTTSHSLLRIEIPQKEPSEKPAPKKDGGKTTATEVTEPNYYVRFRIKLSDHIVLSTIESVANDVIQSAFSKIELFDFRLNDKRYIPSTLTQIIENDKKFRLFYFTKTHYFYMVDVKESIQTASPACHDSRFLSFQDWKSYLDNPAISEKNFISYHWKKPISSQDEKIIKSLQLCYSCLYPDRNFWQLLAYAGLAIILGFMGSMMCFSFSSIISGVPAWTIWIKVILILIIAVLEFIYFFFFNKK